MSTSGLYTNQLTRNQIIEMACRKLGVIADGQTLSTDNYTNGSLAFNVLIGEFRALGMPLWTRNTYSFSPTASTYSYNIGTGYTLNTPYPLKLLQAYRTDSGSTLKVQMDILPDYNFNILPINSSGLPIQVSYTPYVNYGVLKMWPTPDSTAASLSTINIVYQRPTQYMGDAADTVDIPEEWLSALVYNLAVRLAPEWGIAIPDRQALKQEAKEYLDRALEFGAEDGSLFWQVDRRM